MSRMVGIDLGTTNSLVAVFRNGRAEVLADPRTGSRICPSVVRGETDGTVTVGEEARKGRVARARDTVASIKRLMGKTVAEAERLTTGLTYGVVDGGDGVPRVRVADRLMSPPEVASLVLRELKERATLALGEPVDRAVITVPAYFDDRERQATRDAARLAGLKVARLLSEPTAACLAYGLERIPKGRIAVFDLGGGTFDVSILKVDGGLFEVLAINGDTKLGGDDIDAALGKRLLERARVDGVAFDTTLRVEEAARTAAEHAKIALSSSVSVAVALDIPEAGLRWSGTVTRDELETVAAPFIDRTLKLTNRALRDAGLGVDDLDAVALVGGSTRMPLVRARVEAHFGKVPRTDLDPDEVVAVGAALQASVITGENRGITLLDVNPLTLGIETMGGVVAKIIPRNSTLPTATGMEFTTNVDGQTAVLIHVLQGERELAKDNRSLARFVLRGIEPAAAGIPRVEVIFTLDANGILNVMARDKKTGQAQDVDVRPTSGLTDEMVEKMLVEGMTAGNADLEARLLAEARVDAEKLLRQSRKVVHADPTLVRPEEAAQVAAVLKALEAVIAGDDHRAIRRAMETADHVTVPVAQRLMDRNIASYLTGRDVDAV